MKSWSQIALWGALVYLATCCFSCIEGKEDISGQNEPTEVGYLSLRFNTPFTDVSSRADTDYGTVAERKVSKIYMLLYEEGGASGKLMVKTELLATNASGIFTGVDVVDRIGIPRSEHTFVAKAIAVKRQNYQLIMLINPTAAILNRAIENTSTLGEMTAAVTGTNAADYITADGLFMTNAGGIVQVLKSDFREGERNAEEEPVVTPVERIMAKVFVYENRNRKLTEVTTGGKIQSIHWAIDVANKQTFLIRQPDKLRGGGTETGFVADRSVVYAKDPNFTGNKNIVSSDIERDKHFATVDPLVSTGFQPWIGYNETTGYSQYILENTVSQDDQNATDTEPLSYITHVVLRAIITNPGGTITDADYYSFSYINASGTREWKAFTHAQAVEWFNGNYPSDMPVNLHQALTEAQTSGSSPFAFKIENAVEPTPPTAYASVKTTVGQITFHKGGLNIYRIPIQHFGTEGNMAGSDYGYYGVVRNNIYKIIINSINGPGIASSNEGYISAQILVNLWYERGWEENLTPVEP